MEPATQPADFRPSMPPCSDCTEICHSPRSRQEVLAVRFDTGKGSICVEMQNCMAAPSAYCVVSIPVLQAFGMLTKRSHISRMRLLRCLTLGWLPTLPYWGDPSHL